MVGGLRRACSNKMSTVEASDRTDGLQGHGMPLLDMLRRLPPSKELLDFYHVKVERFGQEEEKWLQRLSNAKILTDRMAEMEREKAESKREIMALQKAVQDMQSALIQERKIGAKVFAENDRLKIQELENRQKVMALLEMAGKSDQELVRILDNNDRTNMGVVLEGDFVPQRIRRYIEKIKNGPEKLHSLRQTAGCNKLQITALESQLIEQEQCHLEQISQMENERKLAMSDRETERRKYEKQIQELGAYIKKMDGTMENLIEEMKESKSRERKIEKQWTSEKETLLRKLQFVQTYGTVVPSSVAEGGFFTDNRGQVRRGIEKKAESQIKRLNTELAEQKNLVADYRNQLLSLESQVEGLRDQNAANKEVLKSRTKQMIEQVDSLKSRYEELDTRRKREAEGYQSDINILRQKLKHVEQQLVRATIAKQKEHDYIKTIKAYDLEVDKLKRKLKKQWQEP